MASEHEDFDPSEGVEQRDWRRQLSEDYRHPEMKISLPSALAHRLRRVYLPVLGGLLLVWLFQLNGTGESLPEAAAVSNVPGWAVFSAVVVGYVCLLVIAISPDISVPTESDNRGNLETEDPGCYTNAGPYPNT